MKNKVFSLMLLLSTINIYANNIKYVFIDIAAIVAPSSSAASKHVGIINSLNYTRKTGHLPSKPRFFNALKDVPAKSTDLIYNEGCMMPAIFTDWLAGIQSNDAIKKAVHTYLETTNLFEIEKTIYRNITDMMVTPKYLIDTQYIVKDIAKVIQALQKYGYKVAIVGNWDKESEGLLKNLFNNHGLKNIDTFFSNKIQKVKPTKNFFQELLKHFNIQADKCLLVDIEEQHAQVSRQEGIKTIVISNHSSSQLKSQLGSYGIRV